MDAIVHLGDYIYEYANFAYGSDSIWNERPVAPGHELVSLGDYRTRYGTYRLDTNLIRAHQQHPIISVWDDHEIANNGHLTGAQNHEPATEGNWQDRKENARRAYFEWLPIRDTGTRSIYRTIPYGTLADLIMLDTRLEGRDPQPGSITAPDFNDPNRSMLGDRQRQWLFDQLTQSRARWKIVGQQVVFSEFNIGWSAPLTGNSFESTESAFLDIWDGYPAERQTIVDFLDSADIKNVVLLAGDFHSSFAFEVAVPATSLSFAAAPGLGRLPVYGASDYDPPTGTGAIAVEFATPSLTAANFDENLAATTAAVLEAQINKPLSPIFGVEAGNPNPHMKYVDLDRHGYYVLDVTPSRTQADYYYSDILRPVLQENYGQGLYTDADTTHLQFAAGPAAPKTIQDSPAPADPPGTTSTSSSVRDLRVLSVFPNPAGDFVHIQFGVRTPGRISIDLIDITGRVLLPGRERRYGAGLYTHRVRTAELPPGTYFLRIETAEEVVLQPVLR